MENELPELNNWKSSNYRERLGKCWKGKVYWLEYTLQEAIKDQDLKPFEIPVAAIPLDYQPWDLGDIENICYHFSRVQEVSLEHPIILDDMGCLRDGHHRLVKAITMGKKTVTAVRLNSMPPIDGESDESE